MRFVPGDLLVVKNAKGCVLWEDIESNSNQNQIAHLRFEELVLVLGFTPTGAPVVVTSNMLVGELFSEYVEGTL